MRTASSTSTATRREHAGLVHGDAEQLVGQLHRRLVVRDEDELHRLDISRTMSQKRPTLFSSSGASTSSSRQNGAGFSSKIENTSATAVSAFSPPESMLIELFRLPGGRAMIATPASSTSSPTSSR